MYKVYYCNKSSQEWDSRAYLTVDIPAEKVFDLDEESRVVVVASGEVTTYRQISHNINTIFPPLN